MVSALNKNKKQKPNLNQHKWSCHSVGGMQSRLYSFPDFTNSLHAESCEGQIMFCSHLLSLRHYSSRHWDDTASSNLFLMEHNDIFIRQSRYFCCWWLGQHNETGRQRAVDAFLPECCFSASVGLICKYWYEWTNRHLISYSWGWDIREIFVMIIWMKLTIRSTLTVQTLCSWHNT